MIQTAEDSITFSCSSCGARLNVPLRLAGISGPCPHCQAQITSPSPLTQPLHAAPSFHPKAEQVQMPVHPPSQPVWQPPQPVAVEPKAGSLPAQPQPKSAEPAVPDAAPGGLSPGNFTRSAPLAGQESSPQRRRSYSRGKPRSKKGALLGALLFITLAVAGAGLFFKEQVLVFWNQVMERFAKSGDTDNTGLDPAIAELLKKTSVPTVNGAGKQTPPSTNQVTEPNAIVKSPGGEPIKPEHPAGNPDNTATKKDPAIAGLPGDVEPPPPAPPVGVTPKTNDKLVEVPEVKTIPSPGNDENSAKKALPIESEDPNFKPSKAGMPETIPPIPPAPPTPATSGGLVEVPPNQKGITNLDPPVQERKVFIKAAGEARPAAEVLNQFFQANNWQERLPLTQPVEKVRPLMERYYASNPDGPVRVSSIELIRHEKSPEIGTPLCVFQVSGPDLPEPLPVMVESSSEGWKVDWLTFTEFKDRMLVRYLQKWQDEPARFHVMVRRTHYFDEDVPNLDQKHCFELMPPSPGYSGFAFVPRGTPLAQSLDRAIGWDVPSLAAIVELRWRKQDRYQWVEISAVPQYNWRSTLSAALAQPARALPVESDDDSQIPTRPVNSSRQPSVAEKQ